MLSFLIPAPAFFSQAMVGNPLSDIVKDKGKQKSGSLVIYRHT